MFDYNFLQRQLHYCNSCQTLQGNNDVNETQKQGANANNKISSFKRVSSTYFVLRHFWNHAINLKRVSVKHLAYLWAVSYVKINILFTNSSITKATCKRTQQLPTLLCQQCWELLRLCCSGMQTDATTPNNVAGCCVRAAVVWKRTQQLPTLLR